MKKLAWPHFPAAESKNLASVMDLHVHTNQGSPDSSLTPEELVAEAARVGLDGVMVTEHVGWPRQDFEAFARSQGMLLVWALENYSPLGHIITLGLDSHVTGFTGGIDTVDSAVAHGAKSVIEEQVANGVAVRMALLYGISTSPPKNLP